MLHIEKKEGEITGWSFFSICSSWQCLCFSSPGVIVTEVHKRAGMSEEQYQEVCSWRSLPCVWLLRYPRFIFLARLWGAYYHYLYHVWVFLGFHIDKVRGPTKSTKQYGGCTHDCGANHLPLYVGERGLQLLKTIIIVSCSFCLVGKLKRTCYNRNIGPAVKDLGSRAVILIYMVCLMFLYNVAFWSPWVTNSIFYF